MEAHRGDRKEVRVVKHSVVQERMKKPVRVIFLVLLDICLVNLAAFLALLVRFDFRLSLLVQESSFLPNLYRYAPWFTLAAIGIFVPMKLYNSLWAFAGVEELLHILVAVVLLCLLQLLAIAFGLISLPLSFPILNGLFLVAFIAASRFSYRLLRSLRQKAAPAEGQKRTMLIGAGQRRDAGAAGIPDQREFTEPCGLRGGR